MRICAVLLGIMTPCHGFLQLQADPKRFMIKDFWFGSYEGRHVYDLVGKLFLLLPFRWQWLELPMADS